jgi:peptidoglycan/LPS O-acetylase OafA/YrhL
MKKNLDSLTGLRGIAAVVVFLAHFDVHKSIPILNHAIGFLSWHNAAVDLFFVLSGFTLAYVYSERNFGPTQLKKYLVARFARIYPLHLLTLLAASVLVYRSINARYGTEEFSLDMLRQIFLVSCWAPIGNGTCFNPPSWSISVETFCYIFVFPPLALFPDLVKRVHGRLSTPIFVLSAMTCSYYIFTRFFSPELLLYGNHKVLPAFSYFVNIVRGVLGFSGGVLLHLSFKNEDGFFRFCRKYADLIFCAGLLLMLGHQLHLGVNNHMLVVMSPLLCLACAGGTGYVNRVLSAKLFLHFGDISYSIYLIHYLVILYAATWAHSYSRSPLLILVVYLLSAASYYLYEKPARTLINKLNQSPPKLVAAINCATGRQ